MAGDMCNDDALSYVREFKAQNPQLFNKKNARPLKICLEKFSSIELADLIRRVKEYGGEISSHVDDGAKISSQLELSFKTGFPDFIIEWLHDCVEFNERSSPLEYRFKIRRTNIEHQVEEKEQAPSFEAMNKRSEQRNNAMGCSSTKSGKRKISEASSSSRTQASTNTSINTATESAKCKTPLFYTEEENQIMIDHLIKNKAIKVAGGPKIWRKMHEEGVLLHRTVRSMAKHFCQCLFRRAREFTSDEEALKEFELRENKKYGVKRRRLFSSDSDA